MIQRVKSEKEIKEWNEDVSFWWALHTPPLVLTNEDEMSVDELERQEDCPDLVKEYLGKLRNTQRVFFKRKDDQWAFSLRKG